MEYNWILELICIKVYYVCIVDTMCIRKQLIPENIEIDVHMPIVVSLQYWDKLKSHISCTPFYCFYKNYFYLNGALFDLICHYCLSINERIPSTGNVICASFIQIV